MIMEVWDAYFADGRPANRELIRGEAIPEGLYHLTSEILVRHTDGEYLLMQRAFSKSKYGGFYEATAGGAALKGEDPLTCAVRELREETGISDAFFEEIGNCTMRNCIYHQFLATTHCDKSSVRLQEGETVAFLWLSEKDFIAFVNSDRMIDTQKMRYTAYFKKLGYLNEANPI